MITNDLDLTGETLNNYKIINKLGRGGMATVYKAHELSLNRFVALKVLSTQLSVDKEYIKRFQREAQAAAQLNHPNIMQVYAIGEEKGIYYFAMEYIKGNSLAELKKEIGVLTPEKAVPIIKQVADALAHAHQAGLVHRDIKPSNIMLDAKNNAKVMDFGIAYVLSAETKLTREGSIIGTPEYLSPEQCEGKIVDQRSDIYSLGVTLYELLTGKTPYEADTPVSMLMKIVKGSFPPICEVNPAIPVPLCRVIEKMMKTDVNQRYASMEEVITDLDACGISERSAVNITKPEVTAEILSPQAPQLFEVAPDLAQPKSTKTAPKSNKYAALVVLAIIVLLMGGAFAAKMLFLDKKPAPASDIQPLVANTNPSGSPASAQAQAEPQTQPTETETNSLATSTQEIGNSEAAGPETNSFSETTPLQAGQTPKTTSSSTKTGEATALSIPTSAGQSTKASAPAVPLPPERSCLVKALGDSDKADFVADYLQELLQRRKYTVIDGPSVSDQQIAHVARNLFVVTVKQLGSTTLNYYGSSSEQYTIALTLKVVSPAKGTIIAGPVSQTVKFTDLNAGENIKEAVRALLNALKM